MIPDAHDQVAGLFETVIVLAIQLLIAGNPDLLVAPEDAPPPPPTRRLRHAREMVALARELHLALERYRDHTRPPGHLSTGPDDDIPF